MKINNNKTKFLLILIFIKLYNIKNKYEEIIYPNKQDTMNKRKFMMDNYCSKWIVFTAFNPPSKFVKHLEKNIENWKIVVIGNSGTDNTEWNIFNNSTTLFYLSFEDQKKLKFSINKYLKGNSKFRKIIGYLYAIQRGAEEIYEIDEDLIFNDFSFLNNNFKNKIVSYGTRNDSSQINPYSFFGEPSIWPRGFTINDIGKQSRNIFHYINSSNINLKPLIFQGLINKKPDIDSIFYNTKIKFNNSFNFNFTESYPLIYFPNNFVPINSQNTRYLYEIFPFLMFPISLEENIADIWRGYIMQKFAWKLNGSVIYYKSSIYREKEYKNFSNYTKDKKNYFELNKLIDILNFNINIFNNKYPFKIINDLIYILVQNNLLDKNDINFYKTFEKDLTNVGYRLKLFSSDIEKHSHLYYLKIKSNLELYIPSNPFIIKNDILKLMIHKLSNQEYKDILLIINYNHIGFLMLNDYIMSLYKKNFPNIVFIYPSNINKSNIISCKESYKGYYAYKCLKKVYHKFPNYKGYLIINDDIYLKVWELTNLNFDIPWLYEFFPHHDHWHFYSSCNKLNLYFRPDSELKGKLIKFNGFSEIIAGKADTFYLPRIYLSKLLDLFDIMYNLKIFLECAVPVSIGSLLLFKYQIIYIKPLETGKERKNVMNYLYTKYNQITIHPIKFSNIEYQNKVKEYIYFVNGIKF